MKKVNRPLTFRITSENVHHFDFDDTGEKVLPTSSALDVIAGELREDVQPVPVKTLIKISRRVLLDSLHDIVLEDVPSELNGTEYEFGKILLSTQQIAEICQTTHDSIKKLLMSLQLMDIFGPEEGEDQGVDYLVIRTRTSDEPKDASDEEVITVANRLYDIDAIIPPLKELTEQMRRKVLFAWIYVHMTGDLKRENITLSEILGLFAEKLQEQGFGEGQVYEDMVFCLNDLLGYEPEREYLVNVVNEVMKKDRRLRMAGKSALGIGAAVIVALLALGIKSVFTLPENSPDVESVNEAPANDSVGEDQQENNNSLQVVPKVLRIGNQTLEKREELIPHEVLQDFLDLFKILNQQPVVNVGKHRIDFFSASDALKHPYFFAWVDKDSPEKAATARDDLTKLLVSWQQRIDNWGLQDVQLDIVKKSVNGNDVKLFSYYSVQDDGVIGVLTFIKSEKREKGTSRDTIQQIPFIMYGNIIHCFTRAQLDSKIRGDANTLGYISVILDKGRLFITAFDSDSLRFTYNSYFLNKFHYKSKIPGLDYATTLNLRNFHEVMSLRCAVQDDSVKSSPIDILQDPQERAQKMIESIVEVFTRKDTADLMFLSGDFLSGFFIKDARYGPLGKIPFYISPKISELDFEDHKKNRLEKVSDIHLFSESLTSLLDMWGGENVNLIKNVEEFKDSKLKQSHYFLKESDEHGGVIDFEYISEEAESTTVVYISHNGRLYFMTLIPEISDNPIIFYMEFVGGSLKYKFFRDGLFRGVTYNNAQLKQILGGRKITELTKLEAIQLYPTLLVEGLSVIFSKIIIPSDAVPLDGK